MPRSSYLGLARLGTHPAFSWAAAALVCPYMATAGCTEGPYTRFGEYDKHFLTHDPDAATAYRWLSAKTYERQAPRRGWPVGDDAFERFASAETKATLAGWRANPLPAPRQRGCTGCGRAGGELTENGCPACGPDVETR